MVLGFAACKNQVAASPTEGASSAASQPPAAALAPAPAPVAQVPQSLVSGLPDFTPLVEQVGPSVVNIRVMEKVGRSGFNGLGSGDPMEELLRRFFGIRPDQLPRRGQPDIEEERPTGIGSGFIISSDGYIMTNAHVVRDADSLNVTLADKREFRAKVVGTDKRTDVAVIKVEAQNLPAVRIGNVEALKVGQWVMAIGSPFGLANSVTVGVVSAKQRDTGEYLPFIQTDVAINPGNSGGPLINMAGEVVGINSQIYSRSGGYMGISFSIPIDEAMRIADELRTSGTVTRGRIGVQIAPVSKEVAESLGLPKQQGALVRSVEPGAPAEKAGVQPGDVITHVDGKAVESTADLPRMIGGTKPGTAVKLTLLRNGSNKDVMVTVDKAEGDKRAQGLLQQPGAGNTASAQALGLDVAELSAAQRSQLRIKGGVLVRGVAAGSRAEQAGLQPGDVILSLGQQPVENVAALNAVIGKLPANRPTAILIQREGMAHYGIIRPR
ncbi:MAG: DegQ family serine endoprotease [Comamonadaceae bacterium]|nr:DegQ family serine endoprotease [Comamonadaceae bacterium]